MARPKKHTLQIHIVGNEQIESGYQYRIYVGWKNDEIICLALSRYHSIRTIEKLSLEVDAQFKGSSVFVDVYGPKNPGSKITARFWSSRHLYCYREEYFSLFMNDDNRTDWSRILGANVTFYPFGGPADKPDRFPDFPKQSLLSSIPNSPLMKPMRIQGR